VRVETPDRGGAEERTERAQVCDRDWQGRMPLWHRAGVTSDRGMGQRLRLTKADGVAHIRLVRPEAANAIDLTFALEFRDAAEACAEPGTRVVMLSAEGKQFCGGGDLRSFNGQADLSAHLAEVTSHLHRGIEILVELDAPVVIAVQGPAAGAGLGLVCAGDIVIAAESARFLMAYTAAGLSPDGSSSYFLPRLVGLRRALDLTLTNRSISASEGLEWGLVSRVVADHDVAGEAASLAEALAGGPTLAFGASKRLLRSGGDLRSHLALERETLSRCAGTADGREGVRAFAERRAARFTGG